MIAVQQLEGHVLQPLIMGRAVSLHPLAVILAITTGVVVAGIVGGLVAVPLLAVGNTAVRYIVAHPDGEPTPDRKPPGTQPSDKADGGPIAVRARGAHPAAPARTCRTRRPPAAPSPTSRVDLAPSHVEELPCR